MSQPNIILLMSDQQRWDTLGCNGNAFTETPHLDALAAGGVRCVNSFTPYPVCTPVRATMWTGVYPHAHGVTMNVYEISDALAEFSHEKRTLFASMQEAGYTTAYFGKWHLGEDQPAYIDVWEGWNSGLSHWVDNEPDGVYRPDLQTDQMIEFMRNQADSDRPFVAVNGFYPPHGHYTAPKRFYDPYRGKGILRAGYYAAVTNLDYNVGRIVAALDELGIRENTILVYYSDHGDHFKYRDGVTAKFTCHEDSIRVPFIINGPGTIPASVELNEFVGLEDLMPTVLEWAGLPVPNHLHGKSLLPLLGGQSGAEAGWRESYYVENRLKNDNVFQRAIRTDRWKLILSESRSLRDYALDGFLYDLENDPEEEMNLYYAAHREIRGQQSHFPDHTDQITELAGLLLGHAQRVDDNVGIDIANLCLLQMRKRVE
ncbi:MAG: sulfatase-like hydrolase/transferase [Caldilineaceae bacterium]|nr:sulfatase-like hydrolase/transferase [Caldilineaceae bacterium]